MQSLTLRKRIEFKFVVRNAGMERNAIRMGRRTVRKLRNKFTVARRRRDFFERKFACCLPLAFFKRGIIPRVNSSGLEKSLRLDSTVTRTLIMQPLLTARESRGNKPAFPVEIPPLSLFAPTLSGRNRGSPNRGRTRMKIPRLRNLGRNFSNTSQRDDIDCVYLELQSRGDELSQRGYPTL